ncbi:uncharacterized protein TRIVIDRAFT_51810 [Trichoderma virens Gv29-8]|uniref:DUF4139 domain-containing protein n=1 Tax=Hypocrea virens (strain Gv29-8 / FGSC 10586) TaxID=413071 RepID=G9MWN7_HYPVG|nr:uncharacterized protein TRIVIDRAFT_51810 [Trichoderma virens Gv29-8]EHK21204.1 hypothetical protein TRIVIDRAFT_51810 [Trichoderma virens Gv29-8]UKZ51092.1 hypothetical protein TrVGV298_004847 [Trichoderma virens]
MDSTHKLEYNVHNLKTRSVILFSNGAQVVRELAVMSLRPGLNEITIAGLSPTVQANTVKVEGTGPSAIITGMSVHTVTNQDIFDDVYPDSGSEASDSDPDTLENDKHLEYPSGAGDAKERLRSLETSLEQANEMVLSATSRLKILDSYSTSLCGKSPSVDIEDELAKYKQEREKIFMDQTHGKKCQRDLEEHIKHVRHEISKLEKQEKKAKAKARKNKISEGGREEKHNAKRKREEREREKARVRQERLRFWPKYCYSVSISIECDGDTPMSSRRASEASEIDFTKTRSGQAVNVGIHSCELVLSYITESAGWSPSYDLQLFTRTASAVLFFDAQLSNRTSETWSNCQISLSTSPATLGVEDSTPSLEPWKIKLAGSSTDTVDTNIVQSREEYGFLNTWKFKQDIRPRQKLHCDMFGLRDETIRTPHHGVIGFSKELADFYGQTMILEQQNKKRLIMARQEGHNEMRAEQQASNEARHMQQNVNRINSIQAPNLNFGHDIVTAANGRRFDFEYCIAEESGPNTTYDLPGLKTLPPRSATSKQRVTRLTFHNVVFTHAVLAKYRPVATFKAKLENKSDVTILPGTAGLTLDNCFISRTNLPHCGAGDNFSVDLGVDPAIRLTYSKPETQRVATGIFSKENCSVYTRTLILESIQARVGNPLSILVQDQVPVSEDDRMQVELRIPRGLSVEGPTVSVGDSGRDTVKDKDWGKAMAILKKGGEVNWQVDLNTGKAVRLTLEYAVKFPSGYTAVQCW